MVVVYLLVGLTAIGGTGYFVYRRPDFRKFLAGAFLVSAGVQFYLAWMGVSIPVAGTGAVQTPEVGLVRASIHTVLFILTAYFGFIRKPPRATS